MAEETVGVEMTETAQAGAMPAGEHAQDASATLAELESVRKALKAANAEAATRRKAMEAYEQAEEQRKLAEMSELEKANARAKAAEERVAAIERDAQRERLTHAVTLKARDLNFHDPADAMAFLASDTLTVEEVDAALGELAKARPYLVKADTTDAAQTARASSAATSNIDATKRSSAKPSREQELRQAAEMFGVQVYDD